MNDWHTFIYYLTWMANRKKFLSEQKNNANIRIVHVGMVFPLFFLFV